MAISGHNFFDGTKILKYLLKLKVLRKKAVACIFLYGHIMKWIIKFRHQNSFSGTDFPNK